MVRVRRHGVQSVRRQLLVDLRDVLGADTRRWGERVRDLPTWTERFDMLDRSCWPASPARCGSMPVPAAAPVHSAYYYTPAQAIFVGALIGLAACMIALKGTTPVEDVFLNLGGVFAAVVAIVPTARDADYQAAVRACQDAVGELASVIRRHDRYIWIARIMLLVAAGSAVLMFFDLITLFWLEIAVAALFMAFWTAQTLEVE